MFAPPTDVHADLFCRLPDAFRGTPENLPWVWLNRRGAPTHSFLEAPAFDAEGRLHFVDIPNGRIFRIVPAGEVELRLDYDGDPNGLAFHRDGRLFIADHRNGLLALNPRTERLDTLIAGPPGGTFKGLNDLIFDRADTLYFTDQGQTGLHDPTGRLWRLTAEGALTCLLDNVPSPNGLVLNADESILYLAVTRDNAIWRVPLHPDGRVGRVGRFIQLSGSLGGPDGLAMTGTSVTGADTLVVCQIGMGAVWVFDRLGQPALRIHTPGLLPTNVAVAPDDPGLVFITEAERGEILRARIDARAINGAAPPSVSKDQRQ